MRADGERKEGSEIIVEAPHHDYVRVYLWASKGVSAFGC